MSQTHQAPAEIPWKLLSVPAFPTVAAKALQLLASEDTRLLELYRVVESDPGFATEILRIANSPLYALNTPVKNLTQAAMLLGFERLRGAAVTIGIRSYLGDLLSIPSLRACWRHSLACAMIAERFAQSNRIRSDEVYTAGTLHDIGRIVLATIHPRRYAEFLEKAVQQPCNVLDTERELFGTDHCEAGRILVASWNLPDEFIEITAHHHDKDRKFELNVPTLVRCACKFADALGFQAVTPFEPRTYDQLLEEIPEPYRRHFQCDPVDLAYSIEGKIRWLESA